jgi:hypothetical protein
MRVIIRSFKYISIIVITWVFLSLLCNIINSNNYYYSIMIYAIIMIGALSHFIIQYKNSFLKANIISCCVSILLTSVLIFFIAIIINDQRKDSDQTFFFLFHITAISIISILFLMKYYFAIQYRIQEIDMISRRTYKFLIFMMLLTKAFFIFGMITLFANDYKIPDMKNLYIYFFILFLISSIIVEYIMNNLLRFDKALTK